MKIAVLGSGKVGGTLGAKWARAGHEIKFGVRDPEEKRRRADPKLASFNIIYLTVAEAIRDADVVLFAVPTSEVAGIIATHGSQLDYKILIDATNDFRADQMSKVKELVAAAPSAKVFRAFNSLGWENFEQPVFDGVPADLFYCGPKEGDASVTMQALIEEIGLRPIQIGDLDQVAVVDSIVRLWFSLAVDLGLGRHLAFKTLGI